MSTVLHIDASARRTGSVSRDLTAKIVDRFDGATVITRDLADPLPLIDETWVNANFTKPDQRDDAQTAKLALSDQLIDELDAADVIVIGLPIYNFGVPAALKAWIDQVARAGVTFKYTENGPEGLLKNKRAIIAVASGGTAAGSEFDFATDYVRHVLGFIGIKDVVFVKADRLVSNADSVFAAANDEIAALQTAA